MLTKHKKLLIVLLITFLIRMIVFFIFRPWDPSVVEKDVYIYDAIGYNILAKCIAFNASFCGDTFRTPVYPAFVAVFYYLFGVKPWIVLIAQVLLNVASAYLLFRISERLFRNKNIGYIAVLLFAIDPQQIIFCTYLYTDTLFVFLFLWSMYAFICGLQEGKPLWMLISGILFGLTILTRPIAIYFPVPLFAFALLWQKHAFRKRLLNAGLFVLLSYLLLLPWMYRNDKAYGHFALSSINGYNLLFYNAAFTEVNRAHKSYEQVCEEFVQLSRSAAPDSLKAQMPNTMEERLHGLTFEKSDVYNAVAKDYLKQHFFAAVKAHLSGSLKLHFNMGTEVILERLHIPVERWSDTEKYSGGMLSLAIKFFTSKSAGEIMLGIFVLLFLLSVYATAVLGFIQLTLVEKQWLWSLFFLLLIGYFTIISGIFYTPRYRLPFMPFYMLLSAVCIHTFSKKNAH